MAEEKNRDNSIWAILASILLPQLLGGNKPQPTVQEQAVATPPRGFQDPSIGLMSPTIWDMLLRNLQNLGGAGMPGGSSYLSPSIQAIIDHLGSLAPDLLAGYTGGPTGGGGKRFADPNRVAPTTPSGSSISRGSLVGPRRL